MTRRIVFLSLILVVLCVPLPAAAAVRSEVTANDVRQVRFAERVIVIELVRAMSRSLRSAREQCMQAHPGACPDTGGTVELAIGLLGVSRSSVSAEALVNTLGLRLDGGGAEERTCQILVRGDALSRRLEQLRPQGVAEHCRTLFLELRKRELGDVSDVNEGQVCRPVTEIQQERDELLNAIRSKAKCEK